MSFLTYFFYFYFFCLQFVLYTRLLALSRGEC